MFYLAVTLDGSVIHQSGLMTGGQTTTQSSQKWHDSEIEGSILKNYIQNIF
jgi:structural maintenance of chromosome 1